LGNHISQGRERDFIIEVQELDELLHRDAEIGGREFVGLVPAKWTELSPLENNCIEEA